MTPRRRRPSGATSRTPATRDSFELSTSTRQIIVSSGGTNNRTTGDGEWTDTGESTVDSLTDVAASGVFTTTPTYRSSNPAAFTVDASGRLTRVADGSGYVSVGTTNIRRSIAASVSRSSGATASTFLNYTAGTLAQHCRDQIDERIAGKTFAANGLLYTSQNHVTRTFPRNSAFWGAGITNLSCVSPSNDWTHPNLRGFTAISRRHWAGAAHFGGLVAGSQVVAVDDDSIAYPMTLASNPVNCGHDYYLLTTTEDLPPSIAIAKVLPTDYADYLPTLYAGRSLTATNPRAWGVPLFTTDQEEKGIVTGLWAFASNDATVDLGAYAGQPTDATRAAFWEPVVVNDSGGGAGLLVNDEFVLMTVSSRGSGVPICRADVRTAVEAAMLATGTDYDTLTEVDLTGFPTF